MTSSQMLSSIPAFFAKRYTGSSPATTGSIFVERKKNITSVHFSTALDGQRVRRRERQHQHEQRGEHATPSGS